MVHLQTFGKIVNPRFKGLGFLLILVPVLSYIPLRVLTGALEEEHRGVVLGLSLMLSAAIIFVVALVEDKKSGIEVWSRRAWTSDLLESQHICFHVPLRLAGVAMMGAGIVVALVL